MVNNLPTNEGDARVKRLIFGSGRFLGEGNANPLQNSCQELPWAEEPGRLPSMGTI